MKRVIKVPNGTFFLSFTNDINLCIIGENRDGEYYGYKKDKKGITSNIFTIS